ncbi:hypothetical protein [Niabella drilacis]|uniref:Uncharacterized protein n=1 Tax=Niabella drilacis (strain DSM 25811 / CCM 8410 / CCUG 62505 / LMG 26954 / E90) TaxID=1285928 RepID=A0A1G6RG68_NIADE|nr:hypothetical protein [Niabella drilacis]SDD02995.1 hypothetical protein SAMN04487894_105254 [Niabella drilacis]
MCKIHDFLYEINNAVALDKWLCPMILLFEIINLLPDTKGSVGMFAALRRSNSA